MEKYLGAGSCHGTLLKVHLREPETVPAVDPASGHLLPAAETAQGPGYLEREAGCPSRALQVFADLPAELHPSDFLAASFLFPAKSTALCDP